MRIGIFGGSLNPITNAHLTIIEAAKLQMRLDKVLVIPAGTPYMKDQETIAPAQERLNMARNSIFGESHVEVLDIEIVREGNTYTIDTIKELRKTYPTDTFFLILGADALSSFDQWKDFKEILAETTIVVFARDQVDNDTLWRQIVYLTRAYNAQVTLLDTFIPNISSTIVRQLISEGKSFKHLIPIAARHHIVANKLYGYRSECYD